MIQVVLLLLRSVPLVALWGVVLLQVGMLILRVMMVVIGVDLKHRVEVVVEAVVEAAVEAGIQKHKILSRAHSKHPSQVSLLI